MIINWKDLALKCCDYSAAKGFSPTQWATVPIRIASIQRECDEFADALETWGGERRDHDRLAAAGELADVAIYALIIRMHLGCESWDLRQNFQDRVVLFASPSDIVRPLRKYAGNAHEYWRKGERKDVFIALEILLAACSKVAVVVIGERIDDLIEMKLALMADRPMCHLKDPRS